LSNDFYETLTRLLRSEHQFDYLLIETTGIADPDSIIKAFVSSEAILNQFRIDSVICLVDAVNFEELMDEQPEVRKQLAVADVVLLNKVDEVSEAYAKELLNLIQYLNPMARVLPVSYANIESVDLLDNFSFSGENIQKKALSFGRLTLSKSHLGKSSFVLLKPSTEQYKHEIVSESFVISGSFKPEAFSLWINTFLFFNSKNIFRVKGIVSLEGMSERLIFHAVRDSYINETGDAWGDEVRFSKLVFIGKNIKREQIEDGLYQLLV
jgi:G3E family GTPase